MAAAQCISRLGAWEGYEVDSHEEVRRAGTVWCVIRLKPMTRVLRCCSGCGEWVEAVHDLQTRHVRDLPIFEIPVELVVPRVRLLCPRCGPKLEHLSWLEPYSRSTVRLEKSAARLCKVMSVRHVASFYGLAWTAVKRIDKRYLQRELGPIDLDGVRVIAMDEFAIHKGHRYATVVVEPYCKRVLWLGLGRGRQDIRPFFELLGEQGRAQMQAVAMDMNAGYAEEVRAQCPNAKIVYDLFHVVAKYGRQVIDRVRVDEANRLRHDKPARKLVKTARWLLARNPENVTRPEDKIRLRELLDANKALFTVYVMKDDLKTLWSYRHSGYAERFWQQWYGRAIRSRIAPLKAFAIGLKAYLPGILSHCQWPLGTNLVEGINNKIKVIKRMAYGYRDDAYFFLKIRAAFPGNRR
jgi:transposase